MLAFSTVILTQLILVNTAKADDFGCEALLCFAGGKGVSECQPTIRKVIRDMAKGQGFPVCNFIGSSGSSDSNNNIVSARRYTENWNSRICRDGETRATSIRKGSYRCKTIEINIAPEYSADPAHQKQYFNYE